MRTVNQTCKQDINGVLLLDKPEGITSNRALQIVKRLFNAKKAGHTGSLDPIASGLLPICFGEATKFSQFLLESDKHYFLRAKLGIRTDSFDREGQIISTKPVPPLSKESFEAVLSNFRGEITQLPPMFSALKHQGQPLYKLARQGLSIERNPRTVSIYQLNFLNYESEAALLSLEVKSSKGTYMRTLVDDIGETLGCGAHIVELRRLGAGPFVDVSQMITLSEVERLSQEMNDGMNDEMSEETNQSMSMNMSMNQTINENKLYSALLPVDAMLSSWPSVSLSEAAEYYLMQGQAVIVPYAPKEGWVRLISRERDQFLGIGEIMEDGRVAPRRLKCQQPLVSGG